jgi:hypothetical protein
MRHRNLIFFLILIPALLAPALGRDLSAAGQAEAGSPLKKVPRWESNLSIGAVIDQRMGIVKSFWWYPLPRIVAFGLSFDYVGAIMPLSLNVAVNLPVPVVVPFVCAGAGGTLTRGGITNYGGGLKFRIWHKIGIIVECRKYRYTQESHLDPEAEEKVKADYFGAGIAYIY